MLRPQLTLEGTVLGDNVMARAGETGEHAM